MIFRPVSSRFAAGLCLALAGAGSVAADDALVRRVRDGHRAGRAAVRTLTAAVTFELTHPKSEVVERGRYWRAGDVARMQVGKAGDHTEDAVMKGGEIRSLARHWNPKKSATAIEYSRAGREPGNSFFGRCDAWREMMIVTTGPGGGPLDVDQQFDATDGPVRADRDALDGRECVRIRYSHRYPTGREEKMTQWHDIGRNYLICKLVVESSGDAESRQSVHRVTDFVEPSPGIVFPVRVKREHFRNGEMDQASVTTLTDVVVNSPVPDSALALPPTPHGTKFRDRVENKEGKIDANWQPIGKLTVLPPPAPAPARPTNPAARPTETTQSASEPSSSAPWVIGGSVGVLLVAAAAGLARRGRPGRELAARIIFDSPVTPISGRTMTPSRRHRAFTLVETLVVIGVMGILVGLLMPAVQVVRDTASRVACANNLKQIALAAHLHHDAKGTFPAAMDSLNGGPGSSAWPITNWPTRLLPYLDQQPLWDQTLAACKITSDNNRNPPHVGLTTVVKVYACPSDGRLTAPITDDRGYTAAYGSYEGVGGGFAVPGAGNNGVMRELSGVRIAEITDGASSTLMFGEKPPWGRYFGGTWYASVINDPSLPSDVNWTGGSIKSMHMAGDGNLNNGCRGPFKYGPGRLENRCDQTHFWSLHRAGANFALADGSVRLIRYTAEPVMVALATRAGGETVAVPD